MHFESLVYVFFPGSLPTDVLFVLTVAELEVILNSLPVDSLGSRHSNTLLRGVAQQVEPVVLVQDVDDHGLYATNDLLAVLQVGKFNCRVLLLQFRHVFLLPLILSQEDVFLLPIGDEDVLQDQSYDLQLSPDGPIDKDNLLFLRNVLFLRHGLQFLLLRFLLLLQFASLLLFGLLLVLLLLAGPFCEGEEVVFGLIRVPVCFGGMSAVAIGGRDVSVHAIHAVRVATESTKASHSSHTTHAHPHSSHSAETSIESSSEPSQSSSKTSSQPTSEAESSSSHPSHACREIRSEVIPHSSEGIARSAVALRTGRALFILIEEVIVVELIIGLLFLFAHGDYISTGPYGGRLQAYRGRMIIVG